MVGQTEADLEKRIAEFDFPPALTKYIEKLRASDPPPIIYHYTDGTGLRGIFETGKLWFTDIFNLNDISEIRHGVKPASDLLQSAALSKDAPPKLRFFAETVAKELGGHIEETANYFVCCFSGDGDDLGQWRAYADDGCGYAIGFDAALLEKAFADASPKHHFTFPLSYDDSYLRTMQTEVVSKAIQIVSENVTTITNTQLIKLSVRLSTLIIHCSTFFKHRGYRNEQEYRFLQVHRGDIAVPDLKIRGRPYSLIRYREFDWKAQAAGALKEIIIGPAADPKKAFKFADDCRQVFLSPPYSIAIKGSEIPYRGNLR